MRKKLQCSARAIYALILLIFGGQAAAEETVRVQLKWLHQFQFAGYYAAIEKGYYRDAGLDVELIEGAPGVDPAEVVLSGGAEYGVGTPELLLARAAGKPIVVLGVIFQHSPYVFLLLAEGAVDDVSGLVGKRVMIEPQAAELYAYLRRELIPVEGMTILPHSFSAQALVDGTVDAMSAYATDEPFTLHHLRVPYATFTPRAGGVDFYGDCFFTTEREIREHPARVKAFREATLKGWDYALAHPEEIVDLILVKYGSKKGRDALLFEAAEMRRLIYPEIIPVGYMYEGRWRHIMETYQELGMLDGPVDLAGFLYNPNPAKDYTRLAWIAGTAVALLAASFGILLPVWRLNRRLRVEVAERIQAGHLIEEARDAALRAAQAKMDFLAQISHDLRTPVASILMQAELMEHDATDPKRREEVKVIREAGEHLLALVNDLLDLNRLECGAVEFADVPFRMEDVVTPVGDVLGVAARRKGLDVSIEIDPDLPGLHGDPARVRQILFNLVGNAVKFTDAGSVSIAARRAEDGGLKLEVADTGAGFPAEEAERIFAPFARVPGGVTKDGVGLGLAIVKRLAEAMGGRVWAKSVVGRGSVFVVELPLCVTPSEKTPTAGSGPENAARR